MKGDKQWQLSAKTAKILATFSATPPFDVSGTL